MTRPAPIAVLLLAGPDERTRTALATALAGNGAGGRLRMAHERPQAEDLPRPAACLCCSGPSEALARLEGLLRDIDNARHPPLSTLVVDLGATADPAGLIGALTGHPYLSLRYAPPRLIACLDAAPPSDAVTSLVLLADVIVSPVAAAQAGEGTPAIHRLSPDAALADPVALLSLPMPANVDRPANARALRLRKALSGGR